MALLKKGLVVALSSALLLGACGTETGGSDTGSAEQTTESTENKKIVTFESKTELSTLDGSTYDLPTTNMYLNITENMYRKTGNGNEVELGLAAKHEESEDGLTHTFTLRDDIYWENGDPIVAADFVFGIQRSIDPESAVYPSTSDEIIVNADKIRAGEMELSELGVEAPDDKTLVMHLAYPSAIFDYDMSGGRWAPIQEKFYNEVGAENYGTSADNFMASGPYKIQNWQTSASEWSLVKNENYYDHESVDIDQIDFKVVPETSTAVQLYESGQLDFATLTPDFVPEFKSHEGFAQDLTTFSGNMEANQKVDITANDHFGRAMFYAVDREELTENILADGSLPVTGYVPYELDKNVEGVDFREEAGHYYNFDATKAQEELDAAFKELDIESAELTMIVSEDGQDPQVAEFIQSQLETNLENISVNIEQLPLMSLYERLGKEDWDLAYYTLTPFLPDAFAVLEWSYTDGINLSKYSNEKYDELLDQAKYEFGTDPRKRRDIMMEAEELKVYEDASNSTLHQNQRSYLVNPEIENFETLPVSGYLYFRNVKLNQ
ncbi:peptide ABC transporter substrate-binding protein [Dolosigranulum pigrum]|uniref:peptide ABC transporter substrate-binding protein n=1 Tax=Dolosigranulum pigrum TaxID=29394 RepID=UPI001AD87754|nr:peptide ABC transporter substrate-binding protein [Dolosigranulum pigrum]QTJ34028.1 peptide ABC transporter substrate-binding protein [Dolosigranulum pigrum]QTJ39204.1 peptide ABC transporter substrate-binding protein [Dolosigranulum pigrum]QTJ47693.1 peptide ABC transporter substrate-binding protein [Dolosigranulum pigrum]